MAAMPPLHRRDFLISSMAASAAGALVAGPSAAQPAGQSGPSAAELLAQQKFILAQASRVLENEGVLRGPGHVSARHPTKPDRYLMSRMCPPRAVVPSDIYEFDLDSNPITPLGSERPYSERFMHGEFYKARSDVNAVIHSHAKEVLPFTVVDHPMQVVVIDAARLGLKVPVWDIRTHFGDNTNVMVTDGQRAADMVRAAGKSDVILVRGHGFVAGAESVIHVVHLAIKVLLNAEVQIQANALGKIKSFTPGELREQQVQLHNERIMRRFWDEWVGRADMRGLQ